MSEGLRILGSPVAEGRGSPNHEPNGFGLVQENGLVAERESISTSQLNRAIL